MLIKFLKNYRRLVEFTRENQELKKRAEKAEYCWGEGQKQIAELASQLQMEKHNSEKIEAECMKKILRLAQFAAVRIIEKWGISIMPEKLYKTPEAGLYLKKLILVVNKRFIISILANFFNVSEEELFKNLKPEWADKLQGAVADKWFVRFSDNFSDLDGKLSLKQCCQMSKCGTNECCDKEK